MRLLKEWEWGSYGELFWFDFCFHSLYLSLSLFRLVVFNGWPVVNPVTSGANTATHLRHNQNTPKSTRNNQSHLLGCCIFYCVNLKEVASIWTFSYGSILTANFYQLLQTLLLWIKTFLKYYPSESMNHSSLWMWIPLIYHCPKPPKFPVSQLTRCGE